MDFAVGIVSSFAAEVTKCVFIPVKRHVGYMLNRKANLEDFKKKVDLLKAERERVKHAIDGAERNGEKIEKDVERWLISVDREINEEADKVRALEDKSKKRCFIGLCPNLKSYYQLGKKAQQEAKVVAELLEQGRFDSGVSYRPAVEEIAVALPNKAYQAFQSRATTVDGIMEALRDPNVKTVGVFGMAGVGKTMLVMEVARKAIEDQYLFDEVVMATVSDNPNIRNIQGEIADMLGLKFDEETESGRAMRLRQCFQLRNDKKILVILDDIWGRLDLESIGILFQEDTKVASSNGEEGNNMMQNKVKVRSKILLTSRNQAVLHQMNTQRHFQVGVLFEVEAMELFGKIVGQTVLDKPDYRRIAVEVVAKCAGLPVAVSVIGYALKDKSLDTWDNALQKLKRSNPINIEGMHEGVYSAVELSYKLLKNKEAQLLFQLCALHPQGSDINVFYLKMFSLGLELLKDIDTLDDGRKSVNTAVEKLIASSLLLSNGNDGLVKMHDIIRDVSISIASKEKQMLVIGKEVRMKELLRRGELNNCTAMSLQPYSDDDFHDLPNMLESPNLQLLMLFNRHPQLKLPDSFFSKTTELKVLHLEDIHFPLLPSSFHSITNLRTLSLPRCKLGNISIIGQLKNLDILSFRGSEIQQLPPEIGQLTQLRLLDLSNCSKLKVIPAYIISSLSCLEELYVGNSFDRWDLEGNASLAELKLLHRLTTLHVHIRDPSIMPSDLLCDKLASYIIFIGDQWDWLGKYEHSRTLKLELNASMDDLDRGIKTILKKTEDLYLDQLNGVNNVLSHHEFGRGFPHLKKLHVQNDPHIKYIITNNELPHHKIEFSQLRSLTLQHLPKLISFCFEDKGYAMSQQQGQSNTEFKSLPLFSEKMVFSCLEYLELWSINVEMIWHSQLSNISDYTHNLTTLIIKDCGNLKHILSSSIATSLVNLKCLEIVGCKSLREIILFTEEENNVANISFPQLNSLKLKNLQHLKRFCSDNYTIEFSALKLLEIQHCPEMKGFIYKSTTGKNPPPTLFDVKVAFPSLEKMSISHLRNVKMIWHNRHPSNSFCKVEDIEVEHCDELSTIFPCGLLGTFQRLQTLRVSNCGSVEEIFDLQSLNSMEETQVVAAKLRALHIDNLPKLKHVWSKDPRQILTFQSLSEVNVENCWDLKYVFPASVAVALQQLKDLAVFKCAVEEIVSKGEGILLDQVIVTFEFDQVSSLILWNLPKLKCFYPGMHTTTWPMLKTLIAYHCNEMKIYGMDSLHMPQTNDQHGQMESQIQPPLFLVEKAVPKLEEVSLTSDDIAMISECDSKFSKHLLHEIKVLYLFCYHDEMASFPTTFLKRFNNLERLTVACSTFKELFSYEGSSSASKETNDSIIFSIRNLELNSLYYLKHVWVQDSQLHHILPNLETLQVFGCGTLIGLGLSSAPFRNLTNLDVFKCEALIYLVTSLAAESLVQLENLKISNCSSVKEIVGNEGDEATYNIIFNRLKHLELRHLPRLKSFCFGRNYTFGFPCLNKVIMSHCPEMETFCKGVLNAPSLHGVEVTGQDDDKKHYWDGDLNSTVQQLYARQVEYQEMEYLLLSEYSKSMELWKNNLQGSLHFQNLQCLVVYDCNSLTHIFTTSMALDLVRLEKMIVNNCQMMEQIIIRNDEAKEGTKNTIMFPSLQSITLLSCPNLSSFYMGSNSTVECPVLEALTVYNCPKMVAFTSTPREQDTTDIAPIFSDKVSFPNLRDLRIVGIGNLTKIWDHRLFIDSFCELNTLTVENCEKLLNIFPSNMTERLDKLEVLRIINCESLEEIVESDHHELINSSESTVPMFVFPRMRFLVLQTLPKLKSFYPNMHTTNWPSLKKLQVIGCYKVETLAKMIDETQFDEISSQQSLFWVSEVAFPKLDTLAISHLKNMKMIWHNQLSINSFCSLGYLDVEHCDELLTIFPSEMLHTLKRLQTLRVSSCGSLEVIVELQSFNMDVVDSQLREMDVGNLPKLRHIWNKDPQGSLTFKNLSEVNLWNCWSLKNVFPASVAQVLPKLQYLLVLNCKVEEVVSKGEGIMEATITFEFGQLSFLMLWNLPKLRCFYPGMHATEWPMLKTLITYHCNQVKILGTECLDLPKVNDQDTHFLVEKVVPKLEEVSLTKDDIARISECDSKFSKDLFHEIKVLYLLCYHDESDSFPTTFLKRFNNLERLEVLCSNFNELFSYEGSSGAGKETNAPILFSIKNLGLTRLHYLKHVWVQGSQLHHILPNLETLQADNCGNLISLGLSSTPYQNLMALDVTDCNAMKFLVTSIAVQSLVQLKSLKIGNCVFVKEIVGSEGDEATYNIIFNQLKHLELRQLPRLKSFCSGHNYTFEFPCLDQVTMSHCPEMETFCKGGLSAPMLQRIEVVTGQDGDNQQYWDGDLNSTVKQLYTRKIEYHGMEYLVLSEFSKSMEIWNDNFQESLDFRNLRCLEVFECNSLIYILTSSMAMNLVQLWKMKVKNCPQMEQIIIRKDGTEEAQTSTITFPSLRSLTLESCSRLKSFYLGSNIALKFPSLMYFEVIDCPKMVELASTSPQGQDKETIGISPFFSDKVAFPILKSLRIQGIGNWTRIWDNKLIADSFYELQFLTVKDCERLVNVFPFNMMERLGKLENLKIFNCGSLKEIVEPDHGLSNSSAQSFSKIVFPKMIFLMLHKLPKLKSFCSKMHTINWPSLKELQVVGCDTVEILAMEFISFPEEGIGNYQNQLEISLQHPLFWVNEDTFPNLEVLLLEENGTMKKIWEGQLPTQYFRKLKNVVLRSIPDQNYFIQALQNLESLTVKEADFHEIFQLSEENGGAVLVQLSELRLLELPELTHLWKQEGIPVLGQFFTNLITLQVLECEKLKNLVPSSSSVYFENLTTLEVSQCHGLKNLVTLQTAKTMVLLTKMSIIDCQMMEEIVAHENGNELNKDGIVFSRLKSLELVSLPSLSMFCLGDNYTIEFPFLEEVIMRQCPKMEIFSTGQLSTPMLQGVKSTKGEYLGRWEGQLNAIITQLFVEKVPSLEDSEVCSINFQRNWHCKHYLASSCLAENLTCLTVEGCHSLKYLFSSAMVASFVQLRMLNVDNCENLETVIFFTEGLADEEMMTQTRLFRTLESLLLKDLPKLTTFFHGNYSNEFPLMKVLRIQNCPSLKTSIHHL